MAAIINADDGVISGASGLKLSSDTSGALNIQTNGVTAIAISASQAVSFPATTSLNFASANITNLTATTLTVSAATYLATASGNVGIGTSSPDAPLQIAKSSATSGVVINAQNTTTGSLIQFACPGVANLRFGAPNADAFVWQTFGSGSYPEQMRLTSTGLGIGTTSPASRLDARDTASTTGSILNLSNTSSSAAGNIVPIRFFTGNTFGGLEQCAAIWGINPNAGTNNGGALVFATSANGTATTPSERARITSGGNVGINTSSPDNAQLVIKGGTAYTANTYFAARLQSANYADSGGYTTMLGFGVEPAAWSKAAIGFTRTTSYDVGYLGFYVNSDSASGSMVAIADERARITSAGELLVGQTAGSINATGAYITGGGQGGFCVSGSTCILVNRKASDGTLVSFRQDDNEEGTISVSGATVSYNAFAGSHWSQLQDGSKPDILRGTVMESINELCVWPGEENERLPKAKISDTAGSKKVYGVFMAWDNDWTETNDMYVTAVGAFICRVNGSVTVQEGDLLESNGDGTARVQADDIIRSSTIGKVTSTVKTHQYDDGSYCVPTVLYCG